MKLTMAYPYADLVALVLAYQDGPKTDDERRAFHKQYPVEMAKFRRQTYRHLGLLPVPINGSPNRGLRSGYFMSRLRDGTLGYLQRRTDDCFQAAIASCLQIPMHKVPDLRIEARLGEGKCPEEIDREVGDKMLRWMEQHGVQIMVHPTQLPTSGRWIGVAPIPGLYSDHCLVMDGRECLWDTTGLMDEGIRARIYGTSDIDYAITFR